MSGPENLTAFQQMVSSCSGAILTSVFVTPLDVVKIRLQAQRKPQSFEKGKCFIYCNGLMDHLCPCLNGNGVQGTQSLRLSTRQWYKRPGHFEGMVDAFIQIGRNEGIRSLWSGLPPTLVMAVPATVVYFTTYEQVKAFLGYHHDGPSRENWYKPILAGSGARVFAATVISPLELIRTKMQSEKLTYREVRKAVKDMLKHEGYLSLWKGLGPSLLRDVPFSAIYWFGYEQMKAKVLQERGSVKLTFAESFMSGAIAGSIAGVLTLPFDVIKTHRQIELGRVVLAKAKVKVSTSTWVLIQNLYKSEGFHALFAGLLPRVIKVAPACAIMISSFEFFKAFFAHRNAEGLGLRRHELLDGHSIPSSR